MRALHNQKQTFGEPQMHWQLKISWCLAPTAPQDERWLGRVARMSDDHLPKQLLFGWLPRRTPPHRAKLHWRDKGI